MHRHLTIFLPALVLATSLVSGTAFAFGEDVCLTDTGSLVDCQPLPDECLPAGIDDATCKSAFLAAAAAVRDVTVRMRSTVHTDVTHLLAQEVGFTPDQAYWIAAYDMATDQNVFEPWDLTGAVVGGGTQTTADISGVNRQGFTTGGVLFHFVVPYHGGSTEPDPDIDGLHPHVDDGTTEVLLANTRSWAAAGTGQSRPLCAGGLTNRIDGGDYAHGAYCFARMDGAAAPIGGGLSAVGPVAVPIDTVTGSQTIQVESDAGPAVLSPDFDAAVGAAHAAEARLGIYLHALADRISHHVCTDRGVLSGPVGASREFTADMTNDDCVQTLHALRHGWETGVDYASLSARDRTTEAALYAVFDELVYFAQIRGVLPVGFDAAARRAELVPALLGVLGPRIGIDRVVGIAELACAGGHAPFPGTIECTSGGGSSSTGDAGAGAVAVTSARASAAASEGGSDAGASSEAGGCSAVGATGGLSGSVGFLAAALWRLTRRRSSRSGRTLPRA